MNFKGTFDMLQLMKTQLDENTTLLRFLFCVVASSFSFSVLLFFHKNTIYATLFVAYKKNGKWNFFLM